MAPLRHEAATGAPRFVNGPGRADYHAVARRLYRNRSLISQATVAIAALVSIPVFAQVDPGYGDETSLEDVAVEDVDDAELSELFNGHAATGIASQQPIEFIEWFATDQGEQVTVRTEEETVVLNDSVEIVDAVRHDRRRPLAAEFQHPSESDPDKIRRERNQERSQNHHDTTIYGVTD